MYILRLSLVLLCLPFTWISSIRCRSLPFAKRYAIIQCWSKRILRLLNIELVVEQKEELPSDEPLFFVSNHQGTFDPLILVAGIPVAMSFVSKKENNKIPMISSVSKTLELIYFDRDDTSSAIHMLRESARYLKRKQNLLIFPEGTRSKGRMMLPMKEGAIKPAYLGKAAIVPITQVNTYDMMNVLKHHGTMKLVIHKPIPYEIYRKEDMGELCHRIQKIIQQELLK